jgi:hypothetical protein
VTDALSKLRDLADRFSRSGFNASNLGEPEQAEAYHDCASQLEALLPALEQQLKESNAASWGLGVIHEHNRLEQRERELRLDEALKFQAATFEAGFVFKFAEKRVAELRAAGAGR